ncbi:hypothetical protein ACF3NG_06910 [Aerococcaceae bacterium WGS1372]
MLSSKERDVLEYMPIGRERSKTSDYFKARLGMNRRDLCTIIESLRLKGYPIGSVRGRDGGYYIIDSREDLESTLAVYDAQITKMTKVRKSLSNSAIGGN